LIFIFSGAAATKEKSVKKWHDFQGLLVIRV